MKQTARIEDWQLIGFPGNEILVGKVRDHPRQHNFVSPVQATSKILKMDKENGTCETENTIYTLGTPLA